MINQTSLPTLTAALKAGVILLCLSFLSITTTPAFASATITIINADGAGEGLNDNTAFTAVAGNRATTLGQARLNTVQHAANLIGNIITSTIDIKIRLQFNALGGSATEATLASAGAAFVLKNFTNAPIADTYYPIALAEKLAGVNIATGNDVHEITMTVNSDIDGNTVLLTKNFYYGFDSNPGTDIDLVSIIMHEIVHGLGFSSYVNVTTGTKIAGVDGFENNDTFMRLLEHDGATPADYPSMTNAQRVTASISDTLLHWLGATVIANSGTITAGITGTHVHMYAPSPVETGSSVSHFNTTVTPNEMMEPLYIAADHNIGLAAYVLTDLSWGATKVDTTALDIQVTQTDSNTNITSGENETFTLIVTNNSGINATEVVITNMMPLGATFVSATPDAGSCFQSSNIVTCHLGDLALTGTVNIVIVLTLNNIGTNTNSVFVASVNPDNSIANNASFELTTVDPAPVAAPPGGTKSCFIATAAYGSPMESDVRYLRAFRDQYLNTNSAGRWFVKKYYRYSPVLASSIKQDEALRNMVRMILAPFVKMSKATVSKRYLEMQQ